MKKILTALLLSGVAGLLPAATPGEVFRNYSADDLCVDLAADLTQGNTAVYQKHLDLDVFMERALPKGIKAELRGNYREIMARGMAWTALVAQPEAGSVWYSRRLQRSSGGQSSQVCQVETGGENGMVAIDLVLGEKQGRPVIIDVLDYSDGQLRSASFQRVLGLVVPAYEWEGGRPLNAAGAPLDVLSRQKISVFLLAVSRQDAMLARNSFSTLPAFAQNDPYFISRYIFAVRSDDSLYQDGLKRLAGVASYNPDFSLLLSDYYIERSDKEWMKRIAPTLSHRIGDLPPGLNLVRGLALLAEDDAMLRHAIADNLLRNDGEESLYLSITRHSLRRNDYDTALLALDVLKKRFGYVFTADFKTQDPDMQRLKGTAQFKAWLRRG